MMSDKTKPPLRILPLDAPNVVESKDREFVRLFEAGTATGNGGSRADGGSTPALGAIKRKFSCHKENKAN